MPTTVINLTTSGPSGFILQPDVPGHFGEDLASGDINGDGYDDLIISSPLGYYPNTNSGRVWVVFGGPGPFRTMDMSNLLPFEGFYIGATSAFLQTGRSLGSGGDINGDGYDEIALSSGNNVYIIFGKAGGFDSFDLASLTSTVGFVISNATFCSSFTDVNADGYDDILVGKGNESYVIYGKGGGFGPLDTATLSPSNGFVIKNAGPIIEGAGDYDSDGFNDIVVGTIQENPSFDHYVILSKAGGVGVVDGSGRQVFDAAGLSSADGFKIRQGYVADSAGDVNGDGFDDIVTAFASGGATTSIPGEAYVVFGKPSGAIGPTITGSLSPTEGFVMRGATRVGHTIWSAASAGDINLDGFADVIVGDQGSQTAWIVFGKASGFGTVDVNGRSVVNLDNMTPEEGFALRSTAVQSHFGFSVSTSDVNGDGFSDVMIGAPWDPIKGGGGGRTFIYYGVVPTASVTRTGSAAGQEVSGGTANDTLDGLGGNDLLDGRAGDDTLLGGTGADTLRGGAGADSMTGGADADTFAYLATSDSTAAAVDRLLDFQTGIDSIDLRLTGATSVSWVEQTDGSGTFNLVTVATPAGDMTIRVYGALAMADFQFPTGVINGTAGDDTISGTAGNDEVVGLGGSDSLYGGSGGADRFRGGEGNDNIVVNSRDDVVIELAGQGNDTVFAISSYTLTAGAEVESLGAYNASGAERLDLTGNEYDNRIVGNAGVNLLLGGGGTDTFYGGAGDDYYVVDSIGDQVFEYAGEGFDRVYAQASFILSTSSHVEEVRAYPETVAMDLTGNELDNRLFGNQASNTLDGGAGADILTGGGGSDYYIVDNAGDQVVAGSGFDIVFTKISYALQPGAAVESLGAFDPSSTAALDLTGNELANRIVGNAGSNTLDGGAGNDTLYGEGGNDYYIIDRVGDVVIEAAGNGYDIVFAKASYVLTSGQEIESIGFLNPASTAPLDLTGNEFANRIVGSAGANALNGRAGSDVLYGEGGADKFVFDTPLGPSNVDYLADFNATDDTIVLENAVFTGLAAGGLPSNAFASGTAAQESDDRIIYDSATGNLYFDADGNGAGAQILFAMVQPGTIITAADFQVI
jgi:Ca2+-binding RTX toxin-like protein